MIDLNDLRARPDAYQDAARKKRISGAIPPFSAPAAKGRELLPRVESMRARRNAVSKVVPSMGGGEKQRAIAEMRELASELQQREERKWGRFPEFDFPPKDHVTLGQALDIIDIPRGVKIAGSRSYFLKGDAVRLELAVLRFTLDHLIRKGFTPFAPPLLASWEAMMGTSYFPGGG